MYLLLILASIILLLVILFIIFPLRIMFTLNSEELLNFNLMFSWLSPFFKGIIKNENEELILTVYIFNTHILRKNIKTQGQGSKDNKINFLRKLRPTYIKLRTSYGFKDPSVTGVIYGMINLAAESMNLDSLYNDPNFDTDGTYFNINAQLNINLASMFVKYIRYYAKNHSKQILYGNR